MGVATSSLSIRQGGKNRRLPDPCIVVVFGASGDLTKRKLLPALFDLEQAGLLPEEFAVVGVPRRGLSETFASDFYLAVGPEYFADIAARLDRHGMARAQDSGV